MNDPNVFLEKGIYKRGSSWDFTLTRTFNGVPVDMTGLITRAMFRRDDPAGEVVATLAVGTGITITNPASGRIDLRVSQQDTAKFSDGDTVCFDVEQTNPADPTYAWQSLTYFFMVSEQVTRDE